MSLPTSSDFHKIVIENIPLIDVRAPVEYSQGAFLNSVNLPLMSDKERHEVGICYKNKGSEKALALGYKLVSGSVKQERINAWHEYLLENPKAMIYCFRGGQRSQISQTWIHDELNTNIIRLDGGYKAFRRYLTAEAEEISNNLNVVILGGRTGSGKTILLKDIKNALDLEKLANHRGSSFGRFSTPQPAQIDFENNLSYNLIQLKHAGHNSIVIEDEGRNVGRCIIPEPVHQNFTQGKLIILEVSIEDRIKNTYDEYVLNSQNEYKLARKSDDSIPEWIDVMHANLERIKKRLGIQKKLDISEILKDAYATQLKTGNPDSHKLWIEKLLTDYYDPMYDYQIQKRADKVKFKGSWNEIVEFLDS